MEKRYTNPANPGEYKYVVRGKSGEIYLSDHYRVENYPPNTHFLFSGNVIYMFLKDIEEDKPQLIEMDFGNDWSIEYREIFRYEFIIKHNPQEILVYHPIDPSQERTIRDDILRGESFNIEIYESYAT